VYIGYYNTVFNNSVPVFIALQKWLAGCTKAARELPQFKIYGGFSVRQEVVATVNSIKRFAYTNTQRLTKH